MTPDLARLYPPPPAPRPEHLAALEADLLGRFDGRPLSSRRWLPSRPVRRLAVGTVLVAGLAAASQAPVETAVAVGYRFTIALPEGAPLPPPDLLSEALRGPESTAPGAHQIQAELRVQRAEGQWPTVVADVWSEAPPADVEARLHALPELEGASIAVTPLEGQVHETLAQRLGHDLLDLPSDPASVEAARQRLQAELSRDGQDSRVDLQVDDSQPGRKQVRVKVTRQTPAPDDPPAAR